MTEESKFIEIPKINPKTEKPPKLFLCRTCGAAVGNRKTHLSWHADMSLQNSTSNPYYTDWPPIE